MALSSPDPQASAVLRTMVENFIQERLQLKLDKLGDNEDDKRQRLRDEHQREVWLADAARRVAQIQLASHTLKPLNPDARGTNVYLSEPFCTDAALVGTHVLGVDRADDVVGNAAALDVFKFLKLPAGDKTLLARFLDDDPALLQALSADTPKAQAWAAAFAGIVDSKSAVASHTLGKQLYFPLPDGSYHLLAPLFPTALVHRLHTTLQEDRFSDAAKAARAARKVEEDHPHGYREYLNMVVQNFGGSKPQNISQLNSERGGANHLLASVPPVWQSQGIKPPLRMVSVFAKGGPVARDADLRYLTKVLRKFLVKVIDHNNMAIKAKRLELVQQIIDTVLAIAAPIQCLPGGWSQLGDCRLSVSEKRWLDAGTVDDAHAETPPDDWQDEVSERFGNWLNAALSTDKTLMGDAEFLEWKHQFKEALANEA
ncbi:type I-F CRISPR-associated protein Csy1 [Rhodoferax sp.]|uniref:type I-F CRISPR-associated protein Csy1 n=1 Tax=Rhodoferax sp. TaxID=50421 RepID=UPI00274C67B6|nr:type I-F CRISPR-associated protein Csy1 [Rhodoferax sp.]